MMKESCAVIICNDEGRILLGKRSRFKRESPLLWETIGGTMQRDETPEECIRREVSEELNCDLIDLEYFRYYHYKFKNTLMTTHVFIGKLSGETTINGKELEEIRWFTQKDYRKLQFCLNCEDRIKDYFQSVN